MKNNNNFQHPVSGTRVVGGGVQADTKQDSIEILHIMTEIVNSAKAALHTVHERFVANQPVLMSK